MFISTFADDAIKVFINGKLVEEALKPAKAYDLVLAKYAKAGANTLEIAYEAFGALNGEKAMGDLKGIEFVRVGSDAQTGSAIASLQIQRLSAPMRGRDVDPNLYRSGLESGVLPNSRLNGSTGASVRMVPNAICDAWGRGGLGCAFEGDLRRLTAMP